MAEAKRIVRVSVRVAVVYVDGDERIDDFDYSLMREKREAGYRLEAEAATQELCHPFLVAGVRFSRGREHTVTVRELYPKERVLEDPLLGAPRFP